MKMPEPWLRAQNQTYYIELDGKQHNLGKDKDAAYEEFYKIMARRGLGVREGNHTVWYVVEQYWTWLSKNRSPTTCDRRKPILESFRLFVPQKLLARELKPHRVQKWVDANGTKKVRKKKGVVDTGDPISPTTANTRITIIQGMMSWAASMGYIDRNPIEKMPKPTARIREQYLPPAVWPQLFALVTDETFRDWLIVMLASGCRAQEMFSFEARYLKGERLILPIAESKGRKRARVIYLPPEALVIVERLVKLYPEGPLFRNSKGRPWDKNSVRCRFRRFKRKLKMPELCATTLRHSYAHWRLTSGQDPLKVSKLMGHVDTRMLATRYGHVDSNVDYMKEAASQIPLPDLQIPPTDTLPGQTA